MMKRIVAITAVFIIALAPVAAKGLKGKVVYVNPGHGGWTINDRPHATMNYEEMDTMSFFESKTCLWKGLELRDRLQAAGARVIMSRTTNGWVSVGDKNATANDREETYADENGQQQLITLFKIASQVDSLNPDYFIALHSNATGGGDGKKVNYLLYMYRGETGNDYAKGSIDRAMVAYPYMWDNPLTVWTSSSLEDKYVAGDLTWMGGTPPGEANALGYTGWLQVLKHRVPSFLVEGSFHSYQPERQRLMNRDYCRMEGVRHFRGINAWFGGKPEKHGYIAGTIKSADETINDPLFNYVDDSDDQWLPLNGAVVYLLDSRGVKIRHYKVDNEYNGFFGFFYLKPGRYTLLYDVPGYEQLTEQVVVTRDKTTYCKPRLHKNYK
ncbi:MAG: N-acetylmuramoyl-L-alanine amidase [Muribaculaceae bacterium]|nr:N-acetylmuramoyl-L-alanine amidase [Muribaculaceae bacterium]